MKEDGKHVGVVIDIYRGAEHDCKISVPPLPSSDGEATKEPAANKGPVSMCWSRL